LQGMQPHHLANNFWAHLVGFRQNLVGFRQNLVGFEAKFGQY